MASPRPVLLLKTQSGPQDPYHTLLTESPNYVPYFLPVLTHTFSTKSLAHLRSLFSNPAEFLPQFDAVVLTSQRAVEGLDSALSQSPTIKDLWAAHYTAHLAQSKQKLPFYVVGPATHISVSALVAKHFPADLIAISGQDTGTGEALVEHILAQRTAASGEPTGEPAPAGMRRILFPTGEKRRDTIPRVLGSHGWAVEEVPCYETVTRAEFEDEFATCLRGLHARTSGAMRSTGSEGVVWVVVFSPQGCREMLQVCGWLETASSSALPQQKEQQQQHKQQEEADDEQSRTHIDQRGTRKWMVREESRTPDGRARTDSGSGQHSGPHGARRVYVMSIGPTTQAFLREEFGFEVDAVATKPSAEGVLEVLNQVG